MFLEKPQRAAQNSALLLTPLFWSSGSDKRVEMQLVMDDEKHKAFSKQNSLHIWSRQSDMTIHSILFCCMAHLLVKHMDVVTIIKSLCKPSVMEAKTHVELEPQEGAA